jgi:outer membrane protein
MCAAALASATARAQEVLRVPAATSAPGTPGLGAAMRLTSSPYVGGGDVLDLVPLYLYQGKRLFADGTMGGVHLVKGEMFSMDALVRYRFTQFEADRAEPLGLTARAQTLEAGLRATLAGSWGELEGLWVADTGGRHNGQQQELNYRYTLGAGRWNITPWVSLQRLDASLSDYYFGVSAEEADSSDFAAYDVGTSINTSIGINTSFYLTPNTRFFANVGATAFDSAIRDSPIITEGGAVMAYLGGAYLFGPREEGTLGRPPERAGEWSWRINGGYQAEGNIVGEISTGSIAGSADAATHVAGVTLSKLLVAGRRIDFLGNLAVFRHFEAGLQDNFFSYSGYVVARFEGYSRFSRRETFRFGFGVGFNYASRIPAVEQIKQERREDNNNHLLNYLELSVDFPMRNFTRSPLIRNCYLGATVVHRSGLFGSSDILGSVSGGSDWITGHIECKR